MARTPEEATALVREMFGTTTTAKAVHEVPDVADDSDAEVVDLLTRVCYFYPQYTLKEAENLTDSEVTALLLQAEKQRAIDYYNLTLIAAAPHSKKGAMVSKLTKQYKKVIEL